jgi:hypothetical protein
VRRSLNSTSFCRRQGASIFIQRFVDFSLMWFP